MTAPIILWFRHDLRLQDNEALTHALRVGAPIIPLFIYDAHGEDTRKLGGASQWWLHHSLNALHASLKVCGSDLVIRTGKAFEVLQQLVAETGASSVVWNREYTPEAVKRDTHIKAHLGVPCHSTRGSVLFEPMEIRTGGDAPYRVFTPYYRACLVKSALIGAPLPTPTSISAPSTWPASTPLAALDLLPRIAWDSHFKDQWQPGEAGAHARATHFLDTGLHDYKDARDRPDRDGTSRLSPALHFGEISPRLLWYAAHDKKAAEPQLTMGADNFMRELVWREFSIQLLFYNPDLATAPLQTKFAHFPWAENAAHLYAWQHGQTGYPIVDAGMRQLYKTGWMHNRVRMIVGSLLVKHLLQPWQAGEAWFWDTLLDADAANNAASWQWIGGCGADAAPYFRIFNPMTQGTKFDPQGSYVRTFVPELAGLPDKYIHAPWEAPPLVLQGAGVKLGTTYPMPIVDHTVGRNRALAAFATLKMAGADTDA